MATYSRTVVISVGGDAAYAKRTSRTVKIQAGSSDDRRYGPRPSGLERAGAEVLVERASYSVRLMQEGAGAKFELLPVKLNKVVRINAGAGVRTRTGAEGVCSYLMLRSSAMDEEAFLTATRHGPKGYTDFVRAYPGEYTFKDAVVRSTMLTREPTTMPKLTRLKPIVDVPDRILQGTIDVTDAMAGAVLPFLPAFYSAPEVAVLWHSGATVGFAKVGAATRESVEMYLEDADGFRITGKISYMVQGY